jgi:hypothetical protein
MRRIAWLVLALLPLQAHAFALHWPVDCTLGTTCFIQNFVDHDSSAGAHDFACNPSSYNTHNGTDIRLRTLAAMRAGVAVKAAAAGTVIGTRNTIADNGVDAEGTVRIAGKECGNGVHLEHTDGYRTQYCHLKQGSIRVRTGQQVKAGEVLGQIGLSGKTEFPHLHLSVWKDGVHLDPFTATPMSSACASAQATTARGLWASTVAYQPTALLGDGFANSTPDKHQLRDTPASLATMQRNAPALIYWVDLMNLRAGDVLSLSITAPDGRVVAQKSMPFNKPFADYFAYIGSKNGGKAWAAGTYRATAVLMRAEATAITPVVRSIIVD